MPEARRQMQLEEIQTIVRHAAIEWEEFASLTDDERGRVTLGTTIRGEVARCMVYIPGSRPELGRIINVVDVDRTSGRLTEVDRAEW